MSVGSLVNSRILALALIAVLLHVPVTALGGAGQDEQTFTLALHCSREDADVRSMEHEYLEQGCWGHMGIHTYFMGHDRVHRLHAGEGTAFSVEQQFSPPAEDIMLDPDALQVATPLPIETSLDGLEWHQVAHADYRFVGLSSGGTSLRQEIEFGFELEDPEEFRYLRVRQPHSIARGLSGFLDHSVMSLTVSDAGPAPEPATRHQVNVERSCSRDILETVFDEHPCTYGGIDRWDAPSFFHTYPLENATLDRVEGTVHLAYWRPDDPGTCCGQTLIGTLRGPVLLQSSLNGTDWQILDTFQVTYGQPLEFSLELEGHETRFLRFVSDKHPGYWEVPPLKRPEGYLVSSSLTLTGTLPVEQA